MTTAEAMRILRRCGVRFRQAGESWELLIRGQWLRCTDRAIVKMAKRHLVMEETG